MSGNNKAEHSNVQANFVPSFGSFTSTCDLCDAYDRCQQQGDLCLCEKCAKDLVKLSQEEGA